MKNFFALKIAAILLVITGLSISTTHGVEPGGKTELLWPGGE